MSYQHKELAEGRWCGFSFAEQMANVGSEIERALKWADRDKENSRRAFERCLELLSFTIEDPKNKERLKELTRLREVLIDYFCFDNIYGSNPDNLRNYFFVFNYNAQIDK